MYLCACESTLVGGLCIWSGISILFIIRVHILTLWIIIWNIVTINSIAYKNINNKLHYE
jgi:hypothetical protein